jgi:putative spermidine/putrescine transport system permease protein
LPLSIPRWPARRILCRRAAGAGPVSAYYLLAAVDLARNAKGEIERAPEANRIYIDVLMRTLGISASVTVLCLLLGFPVALLLTQVKSAPPTG